MIELLFSIAAILSYILGVFSQYQKYLGKELTDATNKGNIYNLLYNIATIAGIIFMAYYSYKTKWWAFIGLFVMNIAFYIIITIIVTFLEKSIPTLKNSIAKFGVIATPILLFLLFYFTAKM